MTVSTSPRRRLLSTLSLSIALIAGLAGVVSAQTDEDWTCAATLSDGTLSVSWEIPGGADWFQYKLSVPGEGNRYRRVQGNSVDLEVPAGVDGIVIAMTPIFEGRKSPARTICTGLDGSDTVDSPPSTETPTTATPTTATPITTPATTTPAVTSPADPGSDDVAENDPLAHDCTVETVDGGALLRWNTVEGAQGYQYRIEVEGQPNRYRRISGNDLNEVLIPSDDGDAVSVSFRPVLGNESIPRVECSDGQDNAPTGETNTTVPNEVDESDPAPGEDKVLPSRNGPIGNNFDNSVPDAGPFCVAPGNNRNNPGLRYGDFLLKNSAWNSGQAKGDWSQCISLEENDGKVTPRWTYDWLEPNGADDYQVRSFPEIIYGTKARFETSQLEDLTGLPARYESLPQFQIDYDYTAEQTQKRSRTLSNGEVIYGEANVAIESFFHTTCEIQRGSTGSNKEFEIMLWLASGPERNPDGSRGKREIATIDGADYQVWTKGPKDPGYIAFQAIVDTDSGSLDWSAFIEYVRTRTPDPGMRQFNDDWCMANILFGTEIWWGEGSFQVNQFDITRTYTVE